jgi:lipopolysaccharide export system protein LptA
VIHRATNAPPGDARLPWSSSRQFEFDMPNYRGVYRGQVHGDDPEMEFSCGVLTATGATNSQTFEVLMAEQEVSLVSKKDGLRATGDRAVYTRADERMIMSGNTAWKQGRQEGRADRATLDRREQSLDAHGNVAMKAPRETLSAGGFFLSSTNKRAQRHCHERLAARGCVRALFNTFARSNRRRRSWCASLMPPAIDPRQTHRSIATPADQTATAEGNVVVTHGDQGRGLRSERAVYTKADDKMVFTGKPAWQMERSDGRADVVTVHNSTREIHAEGNVATKVTVGAQQGTLLNFFPESGDTNQGPQIIEVFARELKAKDRQVTFLGDARAHQSPLTGSEPRLRSDTFEVRFGTNSNVEAIRAIDI